LTASVLVCLLLVWEWSLWWTSGVVLPVVLGHMYVLGYVQAVRTNGYVCETLVAVASLSGRFLDLSSATIGNGSDITDLLTSPSLDGGPVPVSCATDAATILADFLRAIAHNQSVVEHETQSLLLQSIENGLGDFVRRLLSGAAVGERRTVTAGTISALSVSRTSLGSVSDQPTSLRLHILGNAAASALEFRLPASFGSDIFGATTPVVDLELSLHGIAPAAGNRTMVSGLSCLTVALPESGTQAVQGLTLPVLITLPLIAPLPASSALVSQFECVFWDRGRYSSKGCRVEGLVIPNSTVTAVICACTHLTMFAVSFAGDPLGGEFVPVTPPSTTQAGTVSNVSSTPPQSIDSVAGTVLVSFNATGAFGLIKSYASLLQQRSAVRGVLTQSISAALATATGHGEGLTVIIILICWGDQCLSYSRRQGASSSSTVVPQMRVDFEVHCATIEFVSLVASNVVLDVFRLQVAKHMEAEAARENLGNWSVVASIPKVSKPGPTLPGPTSNTEMQSPNVEYNDSSTDGGNGTGAKDIVAQSSSNALLITGVAVGSCACISIILCCILRCILEVRRRKRLKMAPAEVEKHCRKSIADNHNYPELADELPYDEPEVNEQSGENRADAQDVPGDDMVQAIGQPVLNRLETPIIPYRDPGATAFTQDNDLPVDVEQGRRRTQSLVFLHGLSNIGDSEEQGATPTLALEAVPAVEKRRRSDSDVRLKHARTKLVNLQRRLDRFNEEAGQQDPARPSLPGAAQAEDVMHSPLASLSSGQPLREQPELHQSDATFCRSVELESPISSASPQSRYCGEPVGQNQGLLLLSESRPSPPDFTRDALAPVTPVKDRSGRLVPSSPLGQAYIIPPPPDTDLPERLFVQPTVAGHLSERLQQLPDSGQSLPPVLLVKPGDATTTGSNMPLQPSVLPERIRPSVWHITPPIDSGVGRPPPQLSPPQPVAYDAVRGEADEEDYKKDPAFLSEDIK
jgi:hypothetical protein